MRKMMWDPIEMFWHIIHFVYIYFLFETQGNVIQVKLIIVFQKEGQNYYFILIQFKLHINNNTKLRPENLNNKIK